MFRQAFLATILVATNTLAQSRIDLDGDDKKPSKDVDIPITSGYLCGAISPDGRTIAMLAATPKFIVQTWTTDGQRLKDFEVGEAMSRLSFSQDSRFLTATDQGKLARTIELATGAMTTATTPSQFPDKEEFKSSDGSFTVVMKDRKFPLTITGERNYQFSPSKEHMENYDVRNVRIHIVKNKLLVWAADAYPRGSDGGSYRSPDLPCGYLRGTHCMHCGKGGWTMYTSFERLVAWQMLPGDELMTLVEHQQHKTHELTIRKGK